jgi:uncharacterized protein with ParB-like and HNH nuclease domain
MIIDAQNRSVSQLFDNDERVVYHVPKYQREYRWGKSQWEQLFDDIQENDEGYFIGSIICINQAKIFEPTRPLELVDGQQRIATLSLLFAAIYSKLEELKGSLNEDQSAQKNNLKWRLILKKDIEKVQDPVRIVLQTRETNYNDYNAVLDEVVFRRDTKPAYANNRKIFKAYNYFRERVNFLSDPVDKRDKAVALTDLLEKVNKASLVIIEVATHSDAYTLFESLNNRGVPLTPIDIIKNKLPASFKGQNQNQIDLYYKKWNTLLDYLGDDYFVQERFFRQYYSAFRESLRGAPKDRIATRANLVKIYEKLIDSDESCFINNLLEAGKRYSFFLGLTKEDKYPKLSKPLLDLERIQGTPSYLLLLYLLANKDGINLSEDNLQQIVEKLTAFFVRRNLTDVPPTRDLTRLFIRIVDEIKKANRTSEDIMRKILHEIALVSSSDATFREFLEGQIYSENAEVVRFILCSIEEHKRGKNEPLEDFWKKDEKRKQYYWTVEHILPQDKNIFNDKTCWVEMIADGDNAKAKELQNLHVDRLGNLTITGYNSALGTMCFEDKRDRNKDGNFIGYKNKLWLNEDLKDCPKWNEDGIKQRTKRLVEETLKMYPIQ